MTAPPMKSTRVKPQALLIGLVTAPDRIEETLEELQRLVEDAGGRVVDTVVQYRRSPDPRFFVGKGKAQELARAAEKAGVDLVVFDESLRPGQMRHLQDLFGVKIVDRVQLILDIFARRARSREAQLQVELAQLQYLLPRLTGKGVELSRLGGGIGTRGPGETFLETKQRSIRRRIRKIQADLRAIQVTRRQQKARRRARGLPVFALVGYTNAGKSTLFAALTGVRTRIRDQLFTTLDPKVRRFHPPGMPDLLISDTVGFIRKLPPSLVAAFRATLDAVYDAFAILHVVDLTSPRLEAEVLAVEAILQELGLNHKPLVRVLNKVDRVEDPGVLSHWRLVWPGAVAISALTGEGLDELLASMTNLLRQYRTLASFRIPYEEVSLIRWFYDLGRVHVRRDQPEGIYVLAEVPAWLVEKFRRYETAWTEGSESARG